MSSSRKRGSPEIPAYYMRELQFSLVNGQDFARWRFCLSYAKLATSYGE